MSRKPVLTDAHTQLSEAAWFIVIADHIQGAASRALRDRTGKEFAGRAVKSPAANQEMTAVKVAVGGVAAGAALGVCGQIVGAKLQTRVGPLYRPEGVAMELLGGALSLGAIASGIGNWFDVGRVVARARREADTELRRQGQPSLRLLTKTRPDVLSDVCQAAEKEIESLYPKLCELIERYPDVAEDMAGPLSSEWEPTFVAFAVAVGAEKFRPVERSAPSLNTL